MKKSTMNVAFALAFGVTALSAQAAALNSGDVLTITAGAYSSAETCINNVCTTSVTNVTGSWFAMDANKDGTIQQGEKVALSQGVQGLLIGTAQNMGGYNTHSGVPSSVAGDSANIVSPWAFFGNTGKNFSTSAITGGTTGVTMSGWNVAWNGISAINMGGGAWGTGFTNGVGNLAWASGVYGGAYTLTYRATVPLGDPSGFGGVGYALTLKGFVTGGPAATAVADLGAAPSAVPVPAAAWLLGSGLLGLVGVARRNKKQA